MRTPNSGNQYVRFTSNPSPIQKTIYAENHLGNQPRSAKVVSLKNMTRGHIIMVHVPAKRTYLTYQIPQDLDHSGQVDRLIPDYSTRSIIFTI